MLVNSPRDTLPMAHMYTILKGARGKASSEMNCIQWHFARIIYLCSLRLSEFFFMHTFIHIWVESWSFRLFVFAFICIFYSDSSMFISTYCDVWWSRYTIRRRESHVWLCVCVWLCADICWKVFPAGTQLCTIKLHIYALGRSKAYMYIHSRTE